MQKSKQQEKRVKFPLTISYFHTWQNLYYRISQIYPIVSHSMQSTPFFFQFAYKSQITYNARSPGHSETKFTNV